MITQDEINEILRKLETANLDLRESENVPFELGLVNHRVVAAKKKIVDAQHLLVIILQALEPEIIPIHTPRFKEDPMPKIEKHLERIADMLSKIAGDTREMI